MSAAKKASIGYVYEDGTVVHKDSDSDAEVNTKPQLNSSNKKGSKPEEVEDEEEDVDLGKWLNRIIIEVIGG